ncbi:unnamed protein product [Tilletia laevis]|uniref:Uncharacterized protein n=2 Tax=Tilletia TaxID=13289 RepID=A0A9N8QFJ7_9BASI|nr:hypothetical protein CF336_g5084 [Tilletia laevis]CAD6889201.1 unnamed protein product [Tilletia caries]KAE8198754.1 hypothetical protein CF335_g4317 [Tilletia laevis]CAD6927337.1 unnamed protein product [Tilletia caries]CAD6929670.1 unnamed protein product [Tilletia laevis]
MFVSATAVPTATRVLAPSANPYDQPILPLSSNPVPCEDDCSLFKYVAAAAIGSIEDGEKIIQTAVDAFGGLHAIVNNAGILHDKSFASDNYSTAKGVKNRIAKIFDFDEERAIYPANNQESLNDIMSNILTSPRHGSLTGSVPTRRAWTRLRCTDCQVTTTPE